MCDVGGVMAPRVMWVSGCAMCDHGKVPFVIKVTFYVSAK